MLRVNIYRDGYTTLRSKMPKSGWRNKKRNLKVSGCRLKYRLDVITSGNVPGGIVSAAEEENVSLIVIGARGEGVLERTILGSVARTVLHTTNHHTLILNDSVVESMKEGSGTVCPQILSKVIFPTDFTEPSDAALDILKGMKGIGTLVLIHVITGGQTAEEIKKLGEETQQRLNTLTGDLATHGITAISHMRFGDPVEEILRCAKEEEVSLIFLSSHGTGWLHALLQGEKSIEVVIHAKRPVLVVRVNPDLS